MPSLQETEYISFRFNRYDASKCASKRSKKIVSVNVKKKQNDDIQYKDGESRFDAIGQMCEAAKKPAFEQYSKALTFKA